MQREGFNPKIKYSDKTLEITIIFIQGFNPTALWLIIFIQGLNLNINDKVKEEERYQIKY